MYNDFAKLILNLNSDPDFQKSFLQFFVKMQQGGAGEAKEFWEKKCQTQAFENTSEMFEQITKLYSTLGFVPQKEYDKVLKENEKLKEENVFLKNTLKELNMKVFSQGSKEMQDALSQTFEKQVNAGKELAESFFDIFKPRT